MRTKTKNKITLKKASVIKNNVPALIQPQDATLALIERAARDKTVDVSKMRELLNMKLDYEKMLRQDAFQRAMIAAQEEMPEVTRDAVNKDNKSKYAKLESIARMIKPVYRKHGFSITYTSRVEADQKFIGCWVMHKDGGKEYHELPGEIEDAGMRGVKNKTPLQGLGVMVSYLRRYLLCMIFDVILIDEDSDGIDPESKNQTHTDPVTARLQDEAPVIDNEVDWKATDGVIIQSRNQKLKYNSGVDAGAYCVQAAHYLKAVIEKRKHKQSRVDLINENLALIRALVKAKAADVVTELHAAADKGE